MKYLSLFIVMLVLQQPAFAEESPLFIATTVEEINLLIEQGADINKHNTYGESLLSHAILNNKPIEFITNLIEKGGDVNSRFLDYGGEPLLNLSLYSEDPAIFLLLVNKGANIHATNSYGVTVLELAIESNRIPVVSYLLQNGYGPNHQCPSGHYVLHSAVKSRNLDMVKLLVDAGAQVDIRNLQQGRTPLHLAVEEDLGEIAEYLIDSKADVNAVDYQHRTPLHFAVGLQDENMTKRLIEKKANANLRDYEERSAAQLAIEMGALEHLNVLLENKADIMLTNFRGETLLHSAARSSGEDSPAILDLLLLNNKIPIDSKDLYGCTPLHYAILNNEKGVQILLNHGANPMARNNDGETPLHLAVSSWPQKSAKRSQKLLIEKGVEINAQDNLGRTPLHIAVMNNNIYFSELLIANGANPHILNHNNQSPYDIVKDDFQPGCREQKILLKLFNSKSVE